MTTPTPPSPSSVATRSARSSENQLEAGSTAFEFTNEADDVNELYVLRENGDVVE